MFQVLYNRAPAIKKDAKYSSCVFHLFEDAYEYAKEYIGPYYNLPFNWNGYEYHYGHKYQGDQIAIIYIPEKNENPHVYFGRK